MGQKRYCDGCSKPLGSTVGKCHDCGGKSRRCGSRFGPEHWQVILGV